MKKYYLKSLMILVMLLSFSFAANAQFVVKVRPGAPKVAIRMAAPSPAHVWVGSNYIWRNGQYVHVDGYWVKPPHKKHHWVDGRWKNTRRGWTWVPGHWR